MSETTDREEAQQMRDYWLERLPVEEAYQAESLWLDNAEQIARLETAREDLIDDALDGELDAGEQHAFDNIFLAYPANVEAVALAKAFRRLIDRKAVAAFDAEAAASLPSRSIRERLGGVFGNFRIFNPALLTGLASLLVFILLGVWLVSRQSDPVNPQIAKMENVNSMIQTPTNTELPDRDQNLPANQPTDIISKNNSKPTKELKTRPRSTAEAVERPEPPPVKLERRPSGAVLNPTQILMGEGGKTCVLQIKNESNTVRLLLLSSEKPTAVEIKLAGEQTPIQTLPVKLKAGQKILNITFAGQNLEAEKEYRFTLLEGDRRLRSTVCRINKLNP